MLIIIDSKMPDEAKENLCKYGRLLELSTSGITYEAISGHPDVFFCQTASQLIVASNIPSQFVEALKEEEFRFTFGISEVGAKYPETAKYNACVAEEFVIHNLKVTDRIILDCFDDEFKIHVNQGYSRCNLLYLGKNKFISSDLGISNSLQEIGFEIFYIKPGDIKLEGFEHGFFGGCTGIFEDKIFVNGSLKHLSEEKRLKKIIGNDFEVVELHDGQLIDTGSIIFLKN